MTDKNEKKHQQTCICAVCSGHVSSEIHSCIRRFQTEDSDVDYGADPWLDDCEFDYNDTAPSQPKALQEAKLRLSNKSGVRKNAWLRFDGKAPERPPTPHTSTATALPSTSSSYVPLHSASSALTSSTAPVTAASSATPVPIASSPSPLLLTEPETAVYVIPPNNSTKQRRKSY